MTCSALARKTGKNSLGDRNARHIHPYIPTSEDVDELRDCEGERVLDSRNIEHHRSSMFD